jgi:GNAT superfamily N-acetyltransferase
VSTFTIRETDRVEHRTAISMIDTSFETSTVFDVRRTARSLELVERTLEKPLTKRYSMGEAFAPWSSWDTGFVAIEGERVTGFAGIEYEAWHARLVLWHLYVTRSRRRSGIGRALLAAAEAHGRELGANSVWLETTSVNVPGFAAYAALGYALCGADVTEYDTLPYADEAALYLSKPLG